ncbi:MAG: hypothetical protein WC455_14015 [Dehalococcoidia bacterium]|jgi:hypothetical protein
MEGGWEDYKPKPSDKGRVMVLYGHEIERSEIPSYLVYDNQKKIEFYWKYKVFGWPYAGGWAEQPAYLLDIIELLESELGKRQKK